MNQLVYGLVTGLLFGFFLQRGQVLRYDKQIGALRLLDMTIIKFMLSAIFVGMVGIYILYDLELVKLSIKATILGATIFGGLLFGLGWGLLGYCPGTAVGAMGEGRWDAQPIHRFLAACAIAQEPPSAPWARGAGTACGAFWA